jgi:hypothetical protein
LFAAGAFDSSGTTVVRHVARWDGATWRPLGVGTNSDVYALLSADTLLYAGGVFDTAGVIQASYVARWDGTTWASVGGGMDLSVYGLARGPAGIYAAGLFTSAGGKPANQVAKWDGQSWQPLDGGVNNIALSVVTKGSDVFVGGAFDVAGASPAFRVARYNDMLSSAEAVLSGWNLVSLPVAPASPTPQSIFPGNLAMYGFNESTQQYTNVTTLETGRGYWAFFSQTKSLTIQGTRIDSAIVASPRVGWILFGAKTTSGSASNLLSLPSGSIAGTPWRFERLQQRYVNATSLDPGEGYWVFVSQPCTIKLGSATSSTR